MEKYEEVPNIISGNDLDYLSDMFSWNYGAYKSTYNSLANTNDEEVKSVIEKGVTLFHTNMTSILNILGGINE